MSGYSGIELTKGHLGELKTKYKFFFISFLSEKDFALGT